MGVGGFAEVSSVARNKDKDASLDNSMAANKPLFKDDPFKPLTGVSAMTPKSN